MPLTSEHDPGTEGGAQGTDVAQETVSRDPQRDNSSLPLERIDEEVPHM